MKAGRPLLNNKMQKRIEIIKKEKQKQIQLNKKVQNHIDKKNDELLEQNKRKARKSIPQKHLVPKRRGAERHRRKLKKQNKSKNYEKEKNNDREIEIIGRGSVKSHTVTLKWMWDHINIRDFINKGTIFYGTTETGKTVFIYDLMYKMKHIFHKVLVFAPTNEEKHDFDGVVPTPFIYESFGLEDIENVYNYQKAITNVYEIANTQEFLLSLFSKVASIEERNIMTMIIGKMNQEIEVINRSKIAGSKRKAKEEIEEKYAQGIKCVAKKCIRRMKSHLLTMNLSDDEKYTLKYLDLNPHILVIFDDAMMEIYEMIREGKKNHNHVIKNFFFKGRHAKITHFYAFQDDTKIDPDMRKNAHISIFTDPNCAHTFFGRKANGFGKILQKQAETIIDEVFDNGGKYEKLIFIKKFGNPWFVQQADLHDDFEMCERNVREYCRRIERKERHIDMNNPFMKKFNNK